MAITPHTRSQVMLGRAELFVQDPASFAGGYTNGWLNLGYRESTKTDLAPSYFEAKADLGVIIEHIPNGFVAELEIENMEIASDIIALFMGQSPTVDVSTVQSGQKIRMKAFHSSNFVRAALVVFAKSWTSTFGATEPVRIVVGLHCAQIIGSLTSTMNNESLLKFNGKITGIAPGTAALGIEPGFIWNDGNNAGGVTVDCSASGPSASVTGLFA